MTVKQAEEQVGKFAREVVLKRAAVVTVVAFALNYAQGKGWIAPDVTHSAQEWVNRGIDYASFLAGAFYIRKAVTPANPALNPTLSDGSAAVAAHQADVPASTVVVQHIYNPAPAAAAETVTEAAEAPAEAEPADEDTSDVDPSLADAPAEEAPAAE